MKVFRLFLILLAIVGAISCPNNCLSCAANATQCETCQAGYELSESKLFCDVSYDHQDQWTGSCNTGSQQSPINIKSQSQSICPLGARFSHTINTVEINIIPAGQNLKASYVNHSVISYTRDGTTNTFKSSQFHWHQPSEHQINGQSMDIQLHVVHSNSDGSGNLAVTGLMFKVDKDMKKDIFDQLNFIPDNSSHSFTFPISLNNKLIYHYKGSLTTPPCSEIVDWFVYTQYFPITKRNFEKIKTAINSGRANSRIVQSLSSRQVEIFGSFCNSAIV